MNTKKMLPLFVLVPVVVVLGVALGVLNHADTEEENTSIALCSLDADSVIAIAYKDASDGATLESALTKTDDTWTLDSDPALPLDQSKAQGVADSMTALTALRELSDDADVASMGFDTPTYELSLKTADTEWTLTVGSKNSITNNWYARLSADGPVYTLDSSALSGICKTAKQLYAAGKPEGIMRQRGKVAFCVLHDCRIGWEGYLHGSMLLYMDKGRDLLANNFILFLK